MYVCMYLPQLTCSRYICDLSWLRLIPGPWLPNTPHQKSTLNFRRPLAATPKTLSPWDGAWKALDHVDAAIKQMEGNIWEVSQNLEDFGAGPSRFKFSGFFGLWFRPWPWYLQPALRPTAINPAETPHSRSLSFRWDPGLGAGKDKEVISNVLATLYHFRGHCDMDYLRFTLQDSGLAYWIPDSPGKGLHTPTHTHARTDICVYKYTHLYCICTCVCIHLVTVSLSISVSVSLFLSISSSKSKSISVPISSHSIHTYVYIHYICVQLCVCMSACMHTYIYI